MKAEIELRHSFERDLQGLSSETPRMVCAAIERLPLLFQQDRAGTYARHLKRLRAIRVAGEYDLSLYSFKVAHDLRVLLTLDEDPLFDKLHITLYAVADGSAAVDDYLRVADMLKRELEEELMRDPQG